MYLCDREALLPKTDRMVANVERCDRLYVTKLLLSQWESCKVSRFWI
jgi:hypothetical protein